MEFTRHTSNLIANLRGLPEDRSRAKLRAAFPLASLVEVLEQKYRIGIVKIEDTIAHRWGDIVGEHAAHRSCPMRVVSGAVLLIQVANPTLRQEMVFQQKEILARIHALEGGHAIHALNFRAG